MGMGDLRSPGSWGSVPDKRGWTTTAPGVIATSGKGSRGWERPRPGPGWHTAAMSEAPPPNPKANDVWIDDHGELRYFNGNEWVPYPDVPDGDLQPEVVIKGEED